MCLNGTKVTWHLVTVVLLRESLKINGAPENVEKESKLQWSVEFSISRRDNSAFEVRTVPVGKDDTISKKPKHCKKRRELVKSSISS